MEKSEKIIAIINKEFEFQELLKRHEIANIRTQIYKAKRLIQKLQSNSEEVKETVSGLIVPYVDHFRLLSCPECNRSDFLNIQGLINHARIVHKVETRSHSHAIRDWGALVEVDASHPARSLKAYHEPVEVDTQNDEQLNMESRFYIKKRIVLGNVSIWKNEKFTWMIYLRSPHMVRFFLHPSYKPFDVVEVSSPPFQITRDGWGEFPCRLQLFFVDELNPPVDLIHVVKLDQLKTGRQKLGGEEYCELELDKNTVFGSIVPESHPDSETQESVLKINNLIQEKEAHLPAPVKAQSLQEEERQTESAGRQSRRRIKPMVPFHANLEAEAGVDCRSLSPPPPLVPVSYALKPPRRRKIPSPDIRLQTYAKIYATLSSAPLISTQIYPYSTAPSLVVWNSWVVGKRLAAEYGRAEFIKDRVAGGLDPFFTAKRIVFVVRALGCVPVVQSLGVDLRRVDKSVVDDENNKRTKAVVVNRTEGMAAKDTSRQTVPVPKTMLRSDIEFVWNAAASVCPSSSIPDCNWDEDSEFVQGGLVLHTAMKVFVKKLLYLGSTRKDVVNRISERPELAFLNPGNLKHDVDKVIARAGL